MKKFAFASIALFAIVAGPAAAQNKSDWDKIVLEDKSGNVMTSTGGDYQTAQVGKQLVIGEYMMLGDATKAKVVYYEYGDNGNVLNRCVRDYTDANTYIIDAACKPAAAWGEGGQISAVNAGIVVGAGLIGAAVISGGGGTPVGPLSTGSRNNQ